MWVGDKRLGVVLSADEFRDNRTILGEGNKSAPTREMLARSLKAQLWS